MPGLSGIDDAIKVFKCPNCDEYVSSNSDFCPECFFRITSEMKQPSINARREEFKEASRKFYKKILYAGLGLLAVGGLLLLTNAAIRFFTGNERIFIWAPIAIVLGIGQIIYALNKLRKEK